MCGLMDGWNAKYYVVSLFFKKGGDNSAKDIGLYIQCRLQCFDFLSQMSNLQNANINWQCYSEFNIMVVLLLFIHCVVLRQLLVWV